MGKSQSERGQIDEGRSDTWQTHALRSRKKEDRCCAEGAMGEAKNSQAEADNLSGGTKADRGGAKSKVGEGEERSIRRAERHLRARNSTTFGPFAD